LYIPVPQTGHLPFVAGLPFFMVTDSTFSASLLVRHFTQYICIVVKAHPLSLKQILDYSSSADKLTVGKISKKEKK
jgi:hypothetical protein